jgi:XTP/dITP diphosphohydrolase
MSLQQLCFATNNSKKLEEIRAILGTKFNILSLADIGCDDEIPEENDTLEANSEQKAQYIFNKYGIECFADDTGLEVDALDGEPGVYSARYAGEQRDNDANMNLVLQKLRGQENRSAQFRTVVTLIAKGKQNAFSGIVRGRITEEKSGVHGFGYDPIFIPENEVLTFAQMTPEAKNKQSHRGRAIAKLVNFLKQ